MSRQSDVDRLYDLIDELQARQGGRRTVIDEPDNGWPSHGVYFFFEPEELRADAISMRCVRVGTHGLRDDAKSTLKVRLRQHRGSLSTGGGHHRGSIFRAHIPGFRRIKGVQGYSSLEPADQRPEDSAKTHNFLVTRFS